MIKCKGDVRLQRRIQPCWKIMEEMTFELGILKGDSTIYNRMDISGRGENT